MIYVSRQVRWAITCLLTVWMTVTGCGVWVTHTHAAGGSPHVHGWGWHSDECPVCHTTRSDGPTTRHRHLLVLGVECPNEEPTKDSSPPDTPAGVAVIDQCEAPTPVELLPALPAPVVVVADLPPPPELRPAVACDRHLLTFRSHFSLRLVSGVLRP